MGWTMRFAGLKLGVLTFAPFYPRAHPRHMHGMYPDSCFIVFVWRVGLGTFSIPEGGLASGGASEGRGCRASSQGPVCQSRAPEAPLSIRDKIRAAFWEAGRPFNAHALGHVVRALDDFRDPQPEWWCEATYVRALLGARLRGNGDVVGIVMSFVEAEAQPDVHDFDAPALAYPEGLLRGIYGYNYERPSRVQTRVLFPFRSGRHLQIRSTWGTGVASCCAIGVLSRLVFAPFEPATQAVVLVRTPAASAALGGLVIALSHDMGPVQTWAEGLSDSSRGPVMPHVVVGTPAVVHVMLQSGLLQPAAVRVMVVMDADEMCSDAMAAVGSVAARLVFPPVLSPSSCAPYAPAATAGPGDEEAALAAASMSDFPSAPSATVVPTGRTPAPALVSAPTPAPPLPLAPPPPQAERPQSPPPPQTQAQASMQAPEDPAKGISVGGAARVPACWGSAVQCVVTTRGRPPPEVDRFCQRHLHDPVRVEVPPECLTFEGIRQFYVAVERAEWKLETLLDLFEITEHTPCLVFTNTRRKAVWVCEHLVQRGISAAALHLDLPPDRRDQLMTGVCQGSIRVVITTDPLVRVNLGQVPMIVNYDMPPLREVYLSRIGWSGHFRRRVIVVNLADNEEVQGVRELELFYNMKIPELPVDFETWM